MYPVTERIEGPVLGYPFFWSSSLSYPAVLGGQPQTHFLATPLVYPWFFFPAHRRGVLPCGLRVVAPFLFGAIRRVHTAGYVFFDPPEV